MSEPSSFRVVYYDNVSVGVPFIWESKPGTPKHVSSSSSSFSERPSHLIRPLTPPPSRSYRDIDAHKPAKRRTKSFAFRSLFPKMSTTAHKKYSDVGNSSEEVAEAETEGRPSSVADNSSYPLLRMFRRSQRLIE